MFIDNPDVFKTWLTSILEPLCDADPAALAKYVYALVKKEKPVEELREGMLDQLDVFLQHETKPFVDMLFKALDSKEYLKGGDVEEEPPAEPEPEAKPPVQAEEAPSNGNTEPPAEAPKPPQRHRVVLPRAPVRHEQTLVTKVMPLTELLEEPLDTPPRRRDRRSDSLRDKDDRRRRGRSWERRGRPRRRPSPRPEARHENRSRSPSPRGRYRNRSPPPPERPLSRSRSRSPMASRKRPHERDRVRPPRELERDRMSRDRDHRDRASHSRDRSRDRSRSGSPILENDRLSPIGGFKRRCRDFDEKGYCMRGDLCQWDHGADPLVLEDAALTRVLAVPRAVPEYNPLAPDIWGGAAGGFPPFPPPPPRELVHIPRVRAVPPPPLMAPRPPPPAPRHPAPHKKNFDYNRLGPQRAPLNHNQGAANCCLEVRKVPRGLNDITHLNNHFSKFGKIVNIQVCYEGDPEAALITFSSHTEANVAYKSTEAVLNNRFIKVFWHNHESKQENVPPPAAPRPASQHPSSANKVLINKDTRPTAIANQANNANNANNSVKDAEKPALKPEATNGQEPKKEPVKPVDRSRQVLEMQRRAQTLLETQLRQQTLLIDKLETGNIQGPQRSALMEAINSTQEGIEKLRKELLAYNKLIKQIQAQVKRPKTREEAQKEILDAELDLFTKQQEGQDVTELMKKVAELRRQMALQFPTHPVGRRPHARGGRFNTATRLVRNNPSGAPIRPAAPFAHQSVDRRPRALLLSGFEADEADGLTQHLQKFGSLTGKELNLAVPELVVQYATRAQAELAFARGRNYNERTLSVTWVPNSKPIAPTNPAPAETTPNVATEGETNKGDNVEPPLQESQEDTLLRFDDEEEEETEDRSWRR